MKKLGMSMVTILLAVVMLFTGMMPMESAQAAISTNDLTIDYIFDRLGAAADFGAVAREWEQGAHAETTACVDFFNRQTNTIFVNTQKT